MGITSAIFSKETIASKLLSFIILDHRVFFFLLHQMEEGKGEDERRGTSDRALAMQTSAWCDTLVIVMNLLRYIKCT